MPSSRIDVRRRKPREAGEVTRQTGGDLSATLTGDAIDGDYTEVYGSGADAVTFRFHFRVSPLTEGH